MRIAAILMTFIIISVGATGFFASAASIGLSGTKLEVVPEFVDFRVVLHLLLGMVEGDSKFKEEPPNGNDTPTPHRLEARAGGL